jgi:hypothetical protein
MAHELDMFPMIARAHHAAAALPDPILVRLRPSSSTSIDWRSGAVL